MVSVVGPGNFEILDGVGKERLTFCRPSIRHSQLTIQLLFPGKANTNITLVAIVLRYIPLEYLYLKYINTLVNKHASKESLLSLNVFSVV